MLGWAETLAFDANACGTVMPRTYVSRGCITERNRYV